MDDTEIKSILNESCRSGLCPELLISCRAAVETRRGGSPARTKREKTRVLVIDDDHFSCQILKLGLEKSGFEVGVEEKSENYRERIENFRPDLLLLDMVMPLVDGLEILDALSADASTRNLPIIVLTGLLTEVDTISLNRDGVLFLAKPLRAKSLVHCIKQHLAAH
jgi:two-component system response regulator VicR